MDERLAIILNEFTDRIRAHLCSFAVSDSKGKVRVQVDYCCLNDTVSFHIYIFPPDPLDAYMQLLFYLSLRDVKSGWSSLYLNGLDYMLENDLCILENDLLEYC